MGLYQSFHKNRRAGEKMPKYDIFKGKESEKLKW